MDRWELSQGFDFLWGCWIKIFRRWAVGTTFNIIRNVFVSYEPEVADRKSLIIIAVVF